MPAWLSEIFQRSSSFMPHGHCYLWIPSLLWMHVISDALIGIAYLGISLILYLLVRSIRLPFSPVFVAFGLFICLCGITHFMKIWTVWHPDYLLDGLIKMATAAASVATAVGLLYVRPQVMEMVSAARLSEQRRVQLEAAHAELESLYRKVKELDELKTQFFANVSHELRTPLALIVGPADSMRNDANLTPRQRRGLDSIKHNGQTLLRQVNDLLDITRLEAGGLELHHARLDLQPWVRRIAMQFDVAAEQRGVRLQVLADQPVVAELDPDLMERVLINLLSNAIKYTVSGGIVVASRRAGDGGHRIEIWDTGIGIARVHQKEIFREFYKVPGHAGTEDGFGLGLYIVARLSHILGHPLTLSSRPGRGTVFRLQLAPTDPQQAAERAAASVAQLVSMP